MIVFIFFFIFNIFFIIFTILKNLICIYKLLKLGKNKIIL